MSKSRPLRSRPIVLSAVLAAALAGGSLLAVEEGEEKARRNRPDQKSPVATKVQSKLAQMPLYFIENQGQIDSRVDYYLQGSRNSVFFTPGGVTLSFSSPRDSKEASPILRSLQTQQMGLKQWVVRQEFVGADTTVRPEGGDRTSAIVSYFKGPREQWKTGIPTHSSVTYRDLWPGVDLTYQGTGSQLKYSFLVQPGSDPSAIRLAYHNAHSVNLNAAGQLDVRTPTGGFKDDRPVAWQESAGSRTIVPASYHLESNGAYGFSLGAYDPTQPLVIDPTMLVYAGYVGGSSTDKALGVAVVGSSAHVTGETSSLDFPAGSVPGPDSSHNGSVDAFVTRLSADGTSLDYAGYIGGSGDDRGHAIAVDGNGNAVITGSTDSAATSFPVIGSFGTTYGGSGDAFVAMVNGAGSALTYAGYLGGSGLDVGYAVAVDYSSGVAYVAGSTASDESTFPETAGSLDSSYNGGTDAFVAKVKTDGSALDYAGYIGGSGLDSATGIAVDASDFSTGAAYLTGFTSSDQNTFPETPGSLDTSYNGGTYDAFVAKVNSTGTAIEYAGYIGGSGLDSATGIAADVIGATYVTGHTESSQPTFPEKIGPDLTYNGSRDAFVARVNPAGSRLTYAGYIGGSGADRGNAVASGVIGSEYAGNAFVAGETASGASTFPEKVGPDLVLGGTQDGFVAKVTLKNLLKNGDFELSHPSGFDNVPDNWSGNASFTQSGDESVTGFNSGKHEANNNANYTVQQSMKVSAGKTYNFEGFVNIPATADAFTFKLQIRWRNSSNGTISTKTIKTYTNVDATDEWDFASASYKAPSGAKSALVRMVVSSLNAIIYVDTFLLI